MTMDEIKALIDAMAASDLAGMDVTKDGWTLRLSRHAGRPAEAEPPRMSANPAPPAGPLRAPAPATPEPAAVHDVRAPLSGLVYLAPAAEAPPYVSVGQAVAAGALLCTVEAMKTFHEVRAEQAGVVAALLVASGDEVEGGQPLLRFE